MVFAPKYRGKILMGDVAVLVHSLNMLDYIIGNEVSKKGHL